MRTPEDIMQEYAKCHWEAWMEYQEIYNPGESVAVLAQAILAQVFHCSKLKQHVWVALLTHVGRRLGRGQPF